MRRDASYAARTGDVFLFADRSSAVNNVMPSATASVTHAAHGALATRWFTLRRRPDLDRAARLHAMMDALPLEALQARYLAEAVAIPSAARLDRTLQAASTAKAPRVRL